MLKKRIAASLVVKDGIVVQSIGFKKYLPVGKPDIAIDFLNQWGIDEIILTDISTSKNHCDPDFEMVKKAAKKCYVPLTVGGGIKKIEHIRQLMHCGADKISLNQSALFDDKIISEAAHVFGDQCVVVSIDGIYTVKGYKVYDYYNQKILDISPGELAKRVQGLGAGEILINSVDRDGSYFGYDIDLINSICDNVSVPVICCGGARNANDFIDVFKKTNVSAASAANFFHFTEHAVNITKSIIKKDIEVRLETFADYNDSSYSKDLRLNKKTDEVLENMLFVRIEKEVI
ncbi:imidazole glycerol phosphate synthase subunit HisF [Pedobacter cryoconitis]|uniref:imidazole glycerol-phosphate synthase n=1 Tax=Pedobacter cryoconitis TaxID=188932 RepID=A0A327T038_9SPHI|nr:imidazole glycerol phosphate synthase cyclase subunit [Pedobacter cryoconitis]RAJ33464.1 cyclase [Pedobacter cryoconitis]